MVVKKAAVQKNLPLQKAAPEKPEVRRPRRRGEDSSRHKQSLIEESRKNLITRSH